MFKSVLALAALIASVAAQGVIIKDPTPYTTLHAGQTIVVDVDRTPSLTGSTDVAVVIGLLTCNGLAEPWTCDGVDPRHNIGQVLFEGPFKPAIQPASGRSDLIQSFTLTVPPTFQKGAALLNVAHFGLVGSNPFLEIVHNTVYVE
ncbi:hypothetical protein C8Q76DRAFT_803738 [Earliella scabrosa]|nr:hypothetical protein C8Q76DRAFT_803738 [Earliella scabrosa]